MTHVQRERAREIESRRQQPPCVRRQPEQRAEWEHARVFAKGVIAIPRLCGDEKIPRDLARFHGPDFRQDVHYEHSLDELDRLLREQLAPLGALSGVPALPPYFVPRLAELEALQDLVLADTRQPVALGPNERVFSVVGMAGAGKSVLAAALTGSLESMTRDEAKDSVAGLGAKVSESVSGKTDYVVVGAEPGSKADKARTLGVTTIGEKDFSR